ncbi:glutathione S-transferase family protein [Ningiella sp. W23]|uniref:glutathione S-transferase family protein n=1 Tax=Ningiella sp. W23 TaxID=3023715 RepID=UPI003756ED9D
MFTLHHLIESRSQRIVWMLEMVGVEYQIKAYKRDAKTNLAPDNYKALHPLGSAPLLEHHLSDGTSTMTAESGAICEYIVQKTGKRELLHGADPDKESENYLSVQFWSHYSEGSFLPPLVATMVLNKARAKAKPFFVKYIANKLVDAILDAYFNKVSERNLKFVEAYLHDNEFFAGSSPTIADVQMSFGLEALVKAGKLDSCPHITEYVARLHTMPSYRAAMEKMASAEKHPV